MSKNSQQPEVELVFDRGDGVTYTFHEIFSYAVSALEEYGDHHPEERSCVSDLLQLWQAENLNLEQYLSLTRRGSGAMFNSLVERVAYWTTWSENSEVLRIILADQQSESVALFFATRRCAS
jgi:hypothetical protein